MMAAAAGGAQPPPSPGAGPGRVRRRAAGDLHRPQARILAAGDPPVEDPGPDVSRRRRPPVVGRRTELARYTVTEGERILYGQRIDGIVRVTDNPASGHGRAFLLERELEHDGNDALTALIHDYTRQAALHDEVPMLRTILPAIAPDDESEAR